MKRIKEIFHLQLWNYLYLWLLISIFIFFIKKDKSALEGTFLELNTITWVWTSIIFTVLHQFYVQIIWRIELITKYFSKKYGIEQSWKIFGVGFFILFILRLGLIFFVGLSNRDTIKINPWICYIPAMIITILVIYAFYSVIRYFTFRRALGIDHFDENYTAPFERRGIYKYTNNGMYIYLMLFVYLPGFIFLSKAALLLGIFNYLYVWGHYLTVERPDMKKIYGKAPENIFKKFTFRRGNND